MRFFRFTGFDGDILELIVEEDVRLCVLSVIFFFVRESSSVGAESRGRNQQRTKILLEEKKANPESQPKPYTTKNLVCKKEKGANGDGWKKAWRIGAKSEK